MAHGIASVKPVVIDQDSSSDSDDSQQYRLREAAVDFQLSEDIQKKKIQNHKGKHTGAVNKPSCRFKADKNDISELDVTPEFSKHVAERLSRMIEVAIEDTTAPGISAEVTNQNLDSCDKDFRLFSSSQWKPPSESSAKKRRFPRTVSSSDSDSAEDPDLSAIAVSGEFIMDQGKKLRRKDAAQFEKSLNSSEQCGILKK